MMIRERSVSQTRLAYVVTGNADVDSIVRPACPADPVSGATHRAGSRRSVGVDPSRDELAFFPLIYWPVVPARQNPRRHAKPHRRLYEAGRHGPCSTPRRRRGAAGENGASRRRGWLTLRNILSSLDVPELEPVPREHVLTKTFYLLHDFPGRFTSANLVETLPARGRRRGGFAPGACGRVFAAHHHLKRSRRRLGAAPDGQPMLPLFRANLRQREFAFRAGVNISYTLTATTRPTWCTRRRLIERLGQ